ncbi:MAG: SDR family oxidoreductase [Oscillospiraceae bacterium]|nr:SDR family oxidoreductase [Oscillospiraceae bacterium]
MSDLSGKIAVVTGAGAKRSMGRAIAMQLAADGADTAVADLLFDPGSVFEEDRDWGGLNRVAEDIRALGRRAVAVKADVSSEADVDNLFKTTQEVLGPADIVVHCVGIRGPVPVPIHEMSLDIWQKLLDVNLTGAFLMGRAAAKTMIPRASGKIVMISSMAGLKAYPGSVAYGATKHGVLGIVKTMAAELGKYGINVNGVCPGRFNTNFRDEHIRTTAEKTGEALGETALKDLECPFPIWLGRAGTPDDISGLVAFLVSDKAAYITGETIVIDGGGG